MLAIRGIYTGQNIQLLEDIHVRPNIRVIVTFLDDEPVEVHHRVPGETAIIIAHRLSTIKSVDRILVLHKGELVEEGSHERLLQQGGMYRQL